MACRRLCGIFFHDKFRSHNHFRLLPRLHPKSVKHRFSYSEKVLLTDLRVGISAVDSNPIQPVGSHARDHIGLGPNGLDLIEKLVASGLKFAMVWLECGWRSLADGHNPGSADPGLIEARWGE